MILSLDPSLSASGWCLLHDDGMAVTGTIVTIGEAGDRIRRLRDFTLAWTARARAVVKAYGSAIVVIEGYAFMGRRSPNVLFEVGGIARGVARVYHDEVEEVMPAVWKRAMMGRLPKGTRSKDADYLREVQRRHGLWFYSTHEADAWMIARYWRDRH